jgi:hypothetical protein
MRCAATSRIGSEASRADRRGRRKCVQQHRRQQTLACAHVEHARNYVAAGASDFALFRVHLIRL